MDADLVEKITRLVLSRLGQFSAQSVSKSWNNQPSAIDEGVNYPPLTTEDVKEWNKITSTICFSKKVQEIPKELMPLTSEELKIWNGLSASMVGSLGEKKNVGEETDYISLTNDEINSWNNLGISKAISSPRDQDRGG